MVLHKHGRCCQANVLARLAVPLLTIITVACSYGPKWAFKNEENISLERAQTLAPFEVCLPLRLPSGVHPIPAFSYHEERDTPAGPPLEAFLYAEYFDATEERVMELQQVYVHTSDATSVPTESPENHVRRLIAWGSDWDWDQVEIVDPDVVWTSSTYQENGITYVAAEITAPDDLRGSVVAWRPQGANGVLYVLYSRLPLTTTLDVVRSVPSCGNQKFDDTA
jgi:hypothetical protein